MTDIANRDANRVTSLLARDYTNPANEVAVTADPATGRLLTQTITAINPGIISATNSTTTPLGINGIFTGSWVDTLAYSEAIVSIGVTGASAGSVTDGLQVQWSGDGVTVHDTDVFTISANSDKTFSFPMQRPYMRVVYQNDGVAQTTFSLQLLLKVYASKGSSHRLKDNLVQEDDAIVTKSLITGFSTAGGGSLVNVKVNPSGALLTGIDTPTTIYNGKKTVTTAGTRVALATTQAVKSVTIKALNANTGTIYVGNSTVASTNGLELLAGDTVSFDMADLATIYLDSSVNGEGVTYLAVV